MPSSNKAKVSKGKLSGPDIDNRRTPRHRARHEACLEADLSLFNAQAEIVPGQDKPLTIFGSTRDLSEAGVSLIVPFVPIDERNCRDDSQMLLLRLYLPTGEVEMQVAPVRCNPLDEREPGEGFFLGARIAEMDSVDRARFNEYLRTFS